MSIPEEAIVAGAKAMDAYWGGRYAPDEVEELRGEVTAMLEAAAPILAAQARKDAALELMDVQEHESRMPGIRFAVGFLGGIKK